ncbi:LysE family transporter [Rubellimicrobium sp. CFH 75288]|nr:LysE family transporter [Rubellimicrobium sp. CFH 75288]
MGLFVVTLSLAILSPGPGIVAVSRAAAQRGRRDATPYALGLAFGASLWCLMALLGLAVLFETAPLLLRALFVAGGAYLVWVGWRMWQGADDPPPTGPAERGEGFGAGLLLNLANPKPGLFYASVLVAVFPDLGGFGARAAVYSVALSVELLFYLGLAALMATAAVRGRYFAAKPLIDRAAGLVVALLGALLLFRL